jgi:seryl-tRNA synthetase
VKKEHFKLKQMTLNQNIISMILTGGLFMIMITSCGPRVQKPVDAFDLIKKERMLSNDSSFVSKEIIKASMKTESVKTEIVKKIETPPDEWTIFKLETEKIIRSNENIIQKIKTLPDLNASSRKKLTSLEKDNNNLKMSLKEYPEEVKAKWEAFKSALSHNANIIDLELIALKTAQKK